MFLRVHTSKLSTKLIQCNFYLFKFYLHYCSSNASHSYSFFYCYRTSFMLRSVWLLKCLVNAQANNAATQLCKH